MNIKKLIAMAMLALAQAVAAQPGSTGQSTATRPYRTFTYDSAGNTLSDSRSYTATYNLRGQLATITKAGVTTTYTYNAKGQRVRKVSSKGPAYTVTFVYDTQGHLLGEYDHTGEALREYVWLRDTPMVVFTPDPANPRGDPLVYFIHTDHLNTPRVVIDRNNIVRWRWISEPFGTTAPETNPSGLGDFTFNLRFPGQYADQESGLFYNYFRYYGPELGRYSQSDPIGLAGGINTFTYVGADPVAQADPNGLLFGATLGGLQRGTTPNQAATYGAPGNAALITGGAGAVGAAVAGVGLYGYGSLGTAGRFAIGIARGVHGDYVPPPKPPELPMISPPQICRPGDPSPPPFPSWLNH